jgi:hypothetical protein
MFGKKLTAIRERSFLSTYGRERVWEIICFGIVKLWCGGHG